MLSTSQFVLLGIFAVLGTSAVIVSVSMLCRGKWYRRLNPEARPRRWVVISMLVLFAVFLAWFPIWIIWPHLLISRLLTALFGITLLAVGLAHQRFDDLIDQIVIRKGWRLR